jgi:hypothetical protein
MSTFSLMREKPLPAAPPVTEYTAPPVTVPLVAVDAKPSIGP